MRLYRESLIDAMKDSVKNPIWSGTLADASKVRSGWTKIGIHRDNIRSEEIDVPTDKKGLLKFLNDMS